MSAHPPSRSLERTRYPGVYVRGSWPNGDPRYVIWHKCSGCQGGICPDGHKKTLPQGTLLRDAHNERARILTDIASGKLVVGQKVRFNTFADEWLLSQEGNLAGSTLELYRSSLRAWTRPAIGNKHLTDVTVDDIARMVGKMKKKGRKAWTIKNVLTPTSRVFDHAVRRGLCPSNPVKALERSERPKRDQRQMRVLSSDEIPLLLAATDEHWRPLVSFLIFTGMRVSEALNVRWEDIDWASGTVTVTSSKTAAGTGRRVTLMPSLQATLRSLQRASQRLTGHVFVMPEKTYSRRDGSSRVGKPVGREYVRAHVLRPAVKRSGVTPVTVHELRHTCASVLLSMGLDVSYIADQLGHANPAITLKVYSHLIDAERRRKEASEKMESAFGMVLA